MKRIMNAKITAMIYSKGKRRAGKGFSIEELKVVNLTPEKALKLRIPIDRRRKTRYEENIKTLKRYLSNRDGDKT
ncbi:MAG: ribosomal protein L13e [Candidatus Bathyarchaeia archaeon]